MEVKIHKSVIDRIEEYKKALSKYPITEERAAVKVDNMMKALLNLGNSDIIPNSICTSADLGQEFDNEGNPMIHNLYRFNYKDESKTAWSFSYIVDKTNNFILVTKMIMSKFVKESHIKKLNGRILSFEDFIK